MPDIGLPEIAIIAVIIFLLFGAQRLPNLGRSLGQSISGFKKGLNEDPADEEKSEETAKAETDAAPAEQAAVVAAEVEQAPAAEQLKSA